MPEPASPTIHRLASDDVRSFRALLAVFGEAFGEPEVYRRAPPSDAYLAGLLGKDHMIVLAAHVGGEVVGGLVAYVLEKYEQERREIYIYDLAVAEAHRRRGVATALIEALRRLADALKAYVLFVQADIGDDPAIALYEKLGRREEVLHFDIAVPRRRG
jgi:aminoglycoside 3-N-acetyltransferase I